MDRSVAAVKVYSVWEEVLNSVSHGIGIVFGAIALVLLILRAMQLHESQYMASAIIYGSSIILLFAASTLYHAIPHRGTKRVFRVIDHSAIYLLIAGTYTPFLLLTMSDAFGVVLMVIVWTLAVAGVIFKVFFVNRFHNLSLITYLGMGWLSLVAAYELATNLPARANALLLTGGLVYSLGTIFYRFKRIPFNHAIWHLFVLGGCVCHFLAVYYFVLTP
ncbi:MAG: hemolysin III family protein [Caldilineaceae bacterium]|nr:hemolysin III family protein [Caldilineaceae bacterium]